MESKTKSLIQDKVALWGLVTAVGGWVFCLLIVAFNWNRLPPQLPLLYSLPWGESWLIAKESLALVLLGFAAILFGNLVLSRTLARKEKLLQYYLLWGATAAEFMLAVNLLKIINLIT